MINYDFINQNVYDDVARVLNSKEIIKRECEAGECAGCTKQLKVNDIVFSSPVQKNIYCSHECYLNPKGKN